MSLKFDITKTGTIGDDTDVYRIVKVQREFWTGVDVWHDKSRNTCRCTQCSGMCSAMLTTCSHAMALKRFLKKHQTN